MSPPVSTRRFSELRLTISDLLQTRNWDRLLDACGTSDPEVSKSIAVIFSLFSPENLWHLCNHALDLSLEERRLKRNSIVTVCYALGRVGNSDVKRSLSTLKKFLLSDHMLLSPVEAAMSNLWVLAPKIMSQEILRKWIQQNKDADEDLLRAGVSSCKYMFENSPESVLPFLKRVLAVTTSDPKFSLCRSLVFEIAPDIRVAVARSQERKARKKNAIPKRKHKRRN